MTRIIWDQAGSHLFEAGVDRGVIYPPVGAGIPWNGLTAVREDVDDNSTGLIYIDGQAYVNRITLGTFSASVSAITYPAELDQFDGKVNNFTGQPRKSFNFSYRSFIGNDIQNTELGYNLHLIYNARLQPSQKTFSSVDADPNTAEFEWGLTATPIAFNGSRASSHLIVDSTAATPSVLAALEDILYGTSAQAARFPSMAEVMALFDAVAIFKVIDNGDGTATVTGPDDWVFPSGTDLWTLVSPSVIGIDSVTYQASSY